MVIQNNPNVQTQGDRLIKVGCIMSNATFKETRKDEIEGLKKVEVEGQKNNLYANNDTEETMPNAIALESSLEFTQR